MLVLVLVLVLETSDPDLDAEYEYEYEYEHQIGRSGSAVVVVNETAAMQLWPGADAIGRVVYMEDRPFTVVGIVGDMRQHGPEQRRHPLPHPRPGD